MQKYFKFSKLMLIGKVEDGPGGGRGTGKASRIKKLIRCPEVFTWYCTHFLKIGFVVAGGGFYSYFIHQGNRSYRKVNCKFYAYKRFITFLTIWVQSRVGAIPRLPSEGYFIPSTFRPYKFNPEGRK